MHYYLQQICKMYLALIICFCSTTSFAQLAFDKAGQLAQRASDATEDEKTRLQTVSIYETNVTGKVTDENNEPLPGVNVVVKGTTSGTVTDVEGDYNINVPDQANILVFSFIGYAGQEVAVNGRSEINVTLTSDVQTLGEVVVVGYGTTEKSDLTGSIVQIKAEAIEKVAATNIQDALAGQVAGALIRSANGDSPGGGAYIRIRGMASTNNAANNPLYVIDGVPTFDDNLSSIDPSFIESIEVLKDASATAIYGSRASAGVIMITTKRGRKGQPKFNFSAKYGVQNASNNYDVINASEHYELMIEGWKMDYSLEELGQIPDYNNLFLPIVYDADKQQPIYDFPWKEAYLVENAQWKKYSLGASGGKEGFTYNVSGSYENRDGIIIGSGFERFALSSAFNMELSPKVNLGLSLIGSSFNSTSRVETGGGVWQGSNFYQTLFTPQWVPAYDQEGNVIDLPTHPDSKGWLLRASKRNKLYRTSNRDWNSGTDRLLTTLNFDYKPIENLVLRTNVGLDFFWENTKNINHMLDFQNNPFPMVSINRQFGNSRNLVLDETATYDIEIGDHSVKAMLGGSIQENHYDFLQLNISGSRNDNLDQVGNMPTYLKDENGNIINNISQSGMPSTLRIASFFGRVNYNYKSRYLLTATLRRDGSSKFGSDNKYGTFPAIGVGWNIDKENFFSQLGSVDNLKLRGSWGLTGNQASIGNFAYLSRVNSPGSVFGIQTVPGALGNPGIQWESIEQLDVGLDLNMFNARLGLSVDFYKKTSKDMLGDLPLNPASGYNTLKGNLGSIQNTGIEIEVKTVNVERKKFDWTTSFNISLNRNEVLDLGTYADGAKKDSIISATNITTIGQPMGIFYLMEFAGIWQQEEAEEALKYNREPGMVKYVDYNNDYVYNNEDRRIMGNPFPKFSGGIMNTFTYQNLQLSFLFTYMGGYQLLHRAKVGMITGNPDFNQLREYYMNSWTPENRSNEYPRMWSPSHNRPDHAFTSSALEDAAFIKLANINVTYNLPAAWVSKLPIQGASIGVSGRNIFTITNYTGLDPEAEGSTNNPFVNGIDDTPYPSARTVMCNLNLNF